MIPEIFIEDWQKRVQWRSPNQVEQDLLISRTLVELYNHPHIKDRLVFRGGTALNKLFLQPAARYSEDIDLVQKDPMPIGETIDMIRNILKPWLGDPKWKITRKSAKLIYSYLAINSVTAKLKIEINTTEHFQVLPLNPVDFSLTSKWFQGKAQISTYAIDELMATKLRALYQRRKGRDLFDLWYVYRQNLIDADRTVRIFNKYRENDGLCISKQLFLENLKLKIQNTDFRADMDALLPEELKWNFLEAVEVVSKNIIEKLV